MMSSLPRETVIDNIITHGTVAFCDVCRFSGSFSSKRFFTLDIPVSDGFLPG